MIKSMTGFGKAEKHTGKLFVQVEIRSVNSRYFDMNLRMPKHYLNHEIEIRNYLAVQLGRGKVFLTINVENVDPGKQKRPFNNELLKLYYQDIEELAGELNLSKENILNTLVNLSDAFSEEGEESSEEDWQVIKDVIITAADNLDEFRRNEGKKLKKALSQYVKELKKLTGQVNAIKDDRISVIRDRLTEKLNMVRREDNFDPSRLEQEVVYYIERLDITEELVRLESHLDHFTETLSQKATGKKLNFISQEIGREINTIGAKASDFEIQKLGVSMKDELEKIREQTQNIV